MSIPPGADPPGREAAESFVGRVRSDVSRVFWGGALGKINQLVRWSLSTNSGDRKGGCLAL